MIAELQAIERVARSGRYVLGPELEAFEAEFAEYLGVRHVVGVSSGTDALYLILQALGVGPGDEVLVPALTFIGTAEAVVRTGATPVFTDVDADTWTMTPETALPRVTARTVAAIGVDLFGNPAPLDGLKKTDLQLIEDACQAAGSAYGDRKCGTLGGAAAFSFYPSKNLACMGDGGAVTTIHADFAEKVRLLRHHGLPGAGTYRLDEIQAAVLRVRLPRLDDDTRRRRLLETDQRPTPGAIPAWHLQMRLGNRPKGARVYYDPPLHLQPAMSRYWRCELPVAENFARENWCESLDY